MRPIQVLSLCIVTIICVIALIITYRAIKKKIKKRESARETQFSINIALARALLRKGNAVDAEILIRESLRKKPSNNDAFLICLAEALLLQGKSHEAIKIHKLVLKRNNYSSETASCIGHQLAVHGFISYATKIYTSAIEKKILKKDFQVLPSYWVDRIGHLVFLDSLLKMEELEWLQKKGKILLTPKERISNSYLLSLYSKYFVYFIYNYDEIDVLQKSVSLCKDIFFGSFQDKLGNESWWIRTAWKAQNEWEKRQKPPLIAIGDADLRECREDLYAFGLKEQEWFVCIQSRNSAFHYDKNDPSQKFRDSDIDTLGHAIFEIINRNGWVIRMGDKTEQKLRFNHPRIIDYPFSALKSEKMDIFLCANCRFFVGTNSGLSSVPSTFGVPTIGLNITPLGTDIFMKKGCFLPKLWWSPEKKRYLNFHELMKEPIGQTHNGNLFHGLDSTNNTSEEIKELVIEMFERLENTFHYSDHEKRLQDEFQRIRHDNNVACDLPIGRSFLNKYKNLLQEE